MLGSGVQMGADVLRGPQMTTDGVAKQIKANQSEARPLLSRFSGTSRFIMSASVLDISVRISFKIFSLTGFVDHSC